MYEQEAYRKLVKSGVRPSIQRLAIMEYLLMNATHPTVEEVYLELYKKIPTLSRTTVYNTLRLFAEYNVAQMITIDEHRVCYDGNTKPHVHFYCKGCGKIIDMMEENIPSVPATKYVDGNLITESQLYYKGVCSVCLNKQA